MKEAFSSVGFIYIKDHGIDEAVIRNAMESSLGYFLLPQEVKEAFPREPDVQQGYVAPGREIFDQKEDGTKVAKNGLSSKPYVHVICTCPNFFLMGIW